MSLERSWRQLVAKIRILHCDTALSHLALPEVLMSCFNGLFTWAAAGGEVPGSELTAPFTGSAEVQHVQLPLSPSRHLC